MKEERIENQQREISEVLTVITQDDLSPQNSMKRIVGGACV